MKKYNLTIRNEEQWLREAGVMQMDSKKLLAKFQDLERTTFSFTIDDFKQYIKRFPEGTEKHPGGATVLLEVLKVYARLISRYAKGNYSPEETKTTAQLAIDEINSYYGDAIRIMRKVLTAYEKENK